jgi:hypothetical protein
MDRPLAYLFDKVYEWSLDTTDPVGASDDKLTRFPRFLYLPFIGIRINLAWYDELSELTGIKEEEEEGLVQVPAAKQLPASINSYNNELDSIRVIADTVDALIANATRLESYKIVVFEEKVCINRCRTKYPLRIDEEDFQFCSRQCSQIRKDLDDLNRSKLEKSRIDAINCLSEHSLESGDGNEAEFYKCLDIFTKNLFVSAGLDRTSET